MQKELSRKVKCMFITLCTIALICLTMSSNAQERKESVYEIGYTATTFEDVKLSGSYGLSMTMLPWEITDNLYVGFHFSPFHFNWGLTDGDVSSDVIKLGPALGYYITPTIFVSLPVVAMCNVSFQGSESNTTWGMACAPSIYVGSSNFGVFAGPMFSMGFEGESKINTGFRAGVYF